MEAATALCWGGGGVLLAGGGGSRTAAPPSPGPPWRRRPSPQSSSSSVHLLGRRSAGELVLLLLADPRCLASPRRPVRRTRPQLPPYSAPLVPVTLHRCTPRPQLPVTCALWPGSPWAVHRSASPTLGGYRAVAAVSASTSRLAAAATAASCVVLCRDQFPARLRARAVTQVV